MMIGVVYPPEFVNTYATNAAITRTAAGIAGLIGCVSFLIAPWRIHAPASRCYFWGPAASPEGGLLAGRED